VFVQVSQTYTFLVQVSVASSGQTSTTSLEVEIVRSDLFVQISGASLQFWHRDVEIDLDASNSYDPDYSDTYIDYSWSCCVVSGEIF